MVDVIIWSIINGLSMSVVTQSISILDSKHKIKLQEQKEKAKDKELEKVKAKLLLNWVNRVAVMFTILSPIIILNLSGYKIKWVILITSYIASTIIFVVVRRKLLPHSFKNT